jgi:hypothetical protein
MLDPDPSVHGRGQMLLLERGIQVGTFDSDLTNQILEMNREFIRDRQELGFKITDYPQTVTEDTDFTVRGTYANKPPTDHSICVFTRRNNCYWPQGRLAIFGNKTWECICKLGGPWPWGVLIARVGEDIRVAVDLYRKVGRDHNKWVGIEMSRLPDGIQVMDDVKVTSVSKEQASVEG